MQDDSQTNTGNTERQQYDFEGTNPAVAVIQTLADATGEEPTELESLFDHIDPDALNTLLLSSNGSGPVTTVSFTVADRRVKVGCDGFVVVTETD
ncbi:HalOD1 output domain-containing protein [Haloarchaeobius litoreus]|uniref:HalOD1 output domain-containing protein n=1 Tax=Haloarchaeobius litoreus TaxID=755306 RepID=A0ABD6DNL1_9EURY|nr:HalOD1 output domain-containing protein [Haloarchaeobius litoreus]